MRRTSTRLHALVGATVILVLSTLVESSPAVAFPDTPYPQLVVNRIVRTSPFAGSTVSMADHEGSAYVARDNSLWLADDNGRKLYEVNPDTGALKRTIDRTTLESTVVLGGTTKAGKYRVRDLESLAYDAANDVLYAFSGPCCSTGVLPTVFRLRRNNGGKFQPESYQPLTSASDFTAAAWNPGDGKVYVGSGGDLRSYQYTTNSVGPVISVPQLTRVTGMVFSADGSRMYATRSTTRLSTVNWVTRSLVPGWQWDLSQFGVLDARAVEIIGDRFWISDGNDFRADGDPLDHALFVLDVTVPAPGFNLISNPGFEQDLAGWKAGSVTPSLSRVQVAHSGSWSARLANTDSVARTLVLNDSPNWIDVTAAGTYTASAWVRSDNSTETAQLKFREFASSGQNLGEDAGTVALSPEWQLVTVSRTVTGAGDSTLDLNVLVQGAAAGTNVYVDDLTLTYSP